jgi:GNAT superfamily N-acetyltransferase
MDLDIREEPIDQSSRLAEISIAFNVTSTLEVALIDDGLGGLSLREVPVDVPWVKDYDAIAGEGPSRWASQFNVANWGLLTAYNADALVGGAVVAFNTPEVHMLQGRSDLSVLWDIRVTPDLRAQGVGTRLLDAAMEWSQSRGCRDLKVETQNINVPACRFYVRSGFALGGFNRFAYPDQPDEVQLIWNRQISPTSADQSH